MVRYRIKMERSEWTQTFGRLKDAIAFAKTDPFFSMNGEPRKGVYILKETHMVSWAANLDTRLRQTKRLAKCS